eukprot:323797-Alexandrium_andersonii.AAC.1
MVGPHRPRCPLRPQTARFPHQLCTLNLNHGVTSPTSTSQLRDLTQSRNCPIPIVHPVAL